MPKQATIVFDLDGTLVDTAPDLTNALNDVMTRRSHAPVPAETVRACVGHGARVMIEEALRRAGATDDIDRMLAEFLPPRAGPFPAPSPPWRVYRRKASRSPSDQQARAPVPSKLLEELDLARYFSGLAGRDTLDVSKPDPPAFDPGHLTQVIALAGVEPTRAIMVGDSEVDAAAAQAAAIPIILVSFGYANEPLDGLKAAVRIDHFDELEAHAMALLNGPSRRS